MTPTDGQLFNLAENLGRQLAGKGLSLTAAESCTGGWLAKVVTDVPGSSAWFERGFVTYSNAAKQEMLGVSETTLAAYGAVSEATVREMVAGGLAHSRADLGVAISGIAGPGGGSDEKPVGTVWLAWSWRRQPSQSRMALFSGEREKIRREAVWLALEGLMDLLEHG